MRDDSADILFQSFLQEALLSTSGRGRDVHSLMLSIQHFLCRPRRHPPSKVPRRMVLERLSWHVNEPLGGQASPLFQDHFCWIFRVVCGEEFHCAGNVLAMRKWIVFDDGTWRFRNVSSDFVDFWPFQVNTLWGSFEINNVRLGKMMLTQFAQWVVRQFWMTESKLLKWNEC